MTVREDDFDVRRFVALLEHFDNTNAGESGNAIRKALMQCADADLSFMDALKLSFANDTNAEEYEEKMNEAAATISGQTEAIWQLEVENNRLRKNLAARCESNSGEDYSGRSNSARWPRAILWIIAAAISCAWLWAAFGHYLPSAIQGTVTIRPRTWALCMGGLFLVWCIAEFRTNGWRVLKIKWLLWAVGWIALVFIIRGLDHAYASSGFFYLTHYYRVALLNPYGWWTTVLTPSSHQLAATLAALLVLAGVVAVNLTEPDTGLLRFMRKVIS